MDAWRDGRLDAILVPMGMLLLVAYHARLWYMMQKHPCTTLTGLNKLVLHAWVKATMKGGLKNGSLIVQTMRNSIMSSSLLAAAAMTVTSMVGYALGNYRRSYMFQGEGLRFGDRNLAVSPPVKLLAILPFFIAATLCFVRSATAYNNATFLLVLLEVSPTSTIEEAEAAEEEVEATMEVIAETLAWAAKFRSLGWRAFAFSVPLFLWLYGAILMFGASVASVLLLHCYDAAPAGGCSPQQRYGAADLALHHPETSPLMAAAFPPDSTCHFCPHV